MPEVFNVALLERAHEEGAVYGSKAVGEPPLMLAFSVREALRQAAAAFGAGRHQRRPRLAGDARGGLLGGRAGAARHRARSRRRGRPGDRAGPARPACTAMRPYSEPMQHTSVTASGLAVDWLAAVERLRRSADAGVLVTLVAVRGHAPREAGAKMVVAGDDTWGTIGGGNLEATAVARARELLADGTAAAGDCSPSPSPTRRPPSTACSAAAVR